MKDSGIYSITCTKTGRQYIGSAVDLDRRWLRHISDLEANRHHNRKLQNSWNKYGKGNFTFKVEALVDKPNLLTKEQEFINLLDPYFNILKIAGSAAGYRHTDEAKLLLSKIAKKRYSSLSEEEKINKAKLHSMRITGKVASEETRRKMSESHKGLPSSEKQKELRSTMRHCHTKEAKRKAILARSKTYRVTSPTGEIIEVTNLSQFCRENGLSQGHLSATAVGTRKTHKGYKAEYLN